jgi:prepilin-type N-terminal cleavage/methylation domain-containing protein
MNRETNLPQRPRAGRHSGFSLVELLASVSIITLLMSAVITFMLQVQKRFQGNQVESESNQSVRAALELMTQEIGQAGYNPDFNPNKTIPGGVAASAAAQCVTLNSISQINPGDWIIVDTGVNSEIVQVTGITGNGCPAAVINQIQARFQMNHTAAGGSTLPIPVTSYKMPYSDGILQVAGSSTDSTVEFFGDINSDGKLNYVVYSLAATTSPATTVCIPPVAPPLICPAASTYTLYNLRRSITPVTFVAGAVNNPSSPMVQNVLYNSASQQGPTGQPIFGYPNLVVLGIVPNQVTVVGTIVITLSVAVNPESMEINTVTWHTLATQIRPLNLTAAIAANQSGGSKYVAKIPPGLPMTNPFNY